MSSDNSSNSNNSTKPPSPPPADMQRNRRGSVTQNAFSQLFQRSGSITGTPVMPSAVTTAAINDQRRRLSLSTSAALGFTGSSPNSATGLARRSSTSTSSEFDENAIDEEDSPTSSRTIPTTPFSRRMSFGAAAAMRRPGGTSPGTVNDQGFNWSEQLRSRAESTVASRTSFSCGSGLTGSPPRGAAAPPGAYQRNRSVSEMPAPPAQAPKPRSPPRDARPKPDPFQERILKGDFYMD